MPNTQPDRRIQINSEDDIKTVLLEMRFQLTHVVRELEDLKASVQGSQTAKELLAKDASDMTHRIIQLEKDFERYRSWNDKVLTTVVSCLIAAGLGFAAQTFLYVNQGKSVKASLTKSVSMQLGYVQLMMREVNAL